MADVRTTTRFRLLPLTLLVLGACGRAGAESVPGVAVEVSAPPSVSTTVEPPPSTERATTTTTTSPDRVVVPATTMPPPTTAAPPPTTTTTTEPGPTTTVEPLPDPSVPAINRAFERLATANAAASMTVVRDGQVVFAAASGSTIEGEPATPDTPMVVASVSKVVTALAVARLVGLGAIDTDGPVPWAELGLAVHPAWTDVTVRELLAHTSGMPKARSTWFQTPGDCPSHLPALVDDPPLAHRGGWVYSNGNYCALGLLVEHVANQPLDVAAQILVFDPVGADGAHLTTDGLLPGDVGHEKGVERLARLGGAGNFVVSTDDLAAIFAAVSPADRTILAWPGVFIDQYGWGHTGSVDGAKSCLWSLEVGRTVVAATIAGDAPATGGGVCDIVVPAVAGDLGLGAGRPDRTPP